MTDITIRDNGDGTGTITISGVPITPYAAPIVTPPVSPPPPVDVASNVLAVCDYIVSESTITVTNKSTSARPVASSMLSRGDGTSPKALAIGESYSYTVSRSTVTPILTVTDDKGVKDSAFMSFSLPTDASGTATGRGAPNPAPPPSGSVTPPPADNPPPVSPPPPPTSSADVPSVIADGLSILYHYPMDETLAATVDHIEIPGTFGGSPETVAKIAWNFGDGTNGWGADGRHPYDKPGTYTITGSVNYRDGWIVPFGPLTVTVAA